MTPAEAKKIVKAKLSEFGKEHKVTARTIGFVDLARDSCIFVKVHGWKPDPAWNELDRLAREHGFRVEP